VIINSSYQIKKFTLKLFLILKINNYYLKNAKIFDNFWKKRTQLYWAYYKRTFFENGEDFGVFYKAKSTYSNV